MISPKVLRTRLATIGHIKIGGLGKAIKTATGSHMRLPVKYDHFQITTNNRDMEGGLIRDESIHKIIGDKPTEIGILLLYNDRELSFRTCLAMYEGKKCACRGNGETAERTVKGQLLTVDCPCPELSTDQNPKGKCKPHGKLSCILEAAQVAGGVHVFDTTSWNSISSIDASLKFLASCSGGRIAGIPLRMTLNKKDTVVEGKPTTIFYVNMVYQGSPVQMIETAVTQAKKMIEAGINLREVEDEARKLLSFDEGPLEEADIPEYHTHVAADLPPEVKQPLPAQAISDIAPPPPPVETTPPVPEPKPPVPETKPSLPETKAPPGGLKEKIVANFTRLRFNKARQALQIKLQAGKPMELEAVQDEAVLQKILKSLEAMK